MKKLITLVLIAGFQGAIAQTWDNLSTYPCTKGGDGSFTFTIGQKIYVGGGFVSKCFYEYDPATDKWTKKADLPVSKCKAFGIGFSINGKGYAGLGFDLPSSSPVCNSDMWEYDPAADTWTARKNYPGNGCDALFCFTVGNKAYMGGGEIPLVGNPFADAYEYDPAADNWTQIADYPDGSGIISAFAFSIGGKGYVSCGTRSGTGAQLNTETRKTYAYDPVANNWTPRKDFEGAARQGGIAFVLNGRAYCGWGDDYQTGKTDFYTYDAAFDKWQYAFEGPATSRTFACAATAGNTAYFGLGLSDIQTNYHNDWYRYRDVTSVDGINIHKTGLFPNPTMGVIGLPNTKDYAYTVRAMTGEVVQSGRAANGVLDISTLPNAVYILELTQDEYKQAGRVVKY